MTRGSFKLHARLVEKYKYPTDWMLEDINLKAKDIITVHYELPLTVFKSYGCYSNKTPDIIYRTDRSEGNFYYIGEIKSATHKKAKSRAAEKSMIYSRILNNYAIPHKSFLVTGLTERAEFTEKVYKEFIRLGYYLNKSQHKKQR